MQTQDQERQTTLQQFADAANERLAANTGEAPARTRVFRVAADPDRHVEFSPLLTRKLNGQEFQILRPLSGDPTLVLAWSTECRNGASARTIRVQPHVTPERRRGRAPTRSRGVDW